MTIKKLKRVRRSIRVRSKIVGSAKRPRLTVFRSNKYIYAQIIDHAGKTLVWASQKEIDREKKFTKSQAAAKVGELLAGKALQAKVSQVIFDRGSYKYHGRVKALAEAARKAGLKI